MQVYADFVANLSSFLIEAGIATPSTLMGCSEREIAEYESWFPSRLPAAYVAFLREMGHASGKFMSDMGDATWEENREVARKLTADPHCQWQLTKTIVPLSQYEHSQLLFLDLAEGDDPRVFHYMERHALPKVVAPTFTSCLRENALDAIEHKPWNDEVCREIGMHRDDWMERKQVIDRYEEQSHAIRDGLIEKVAAEDARRGRITGPVEFQSIWLEEFVKTDLCSILKQEGKRVPWGWLRPSDATGHKE